MARQIRWSALVIFLGFLALGFGAGYWQVVRSDDLASRSGNPRIAELSAREQRGTIWSADSVRLAWSATGDDGRRARMYALPSLAHLLGYVSRTYGVSGIEEQYNDQLSGSRSGQPLEQLWHDLTRERLPGNDLVLTIDTRVQQAAAEALGDRPGAVVAIDPRTGAVLAMVSSPGFDPATIEETGEALLTDPDAPLINRATQGQYAPGSIFKSVTAVAALESGEFRPESTFRCPSGVVVQGFVIACAGVPPNVREYDFAHAYAWSVNANFAEIGLKVGAPTLVAQARRFGFEEEIPFDLPVTPSRLLQPGKAFNDVLLATTAFGQGELAATPLQMALVAAAVANDGTIMQPYLVQQVKDPAGEILQDKRPRRWREVMRSETAATLRRFMTTAVQEGFGGGAAIPGVAVGGKTGTAENAPGEPPHAWFTGIAPVEDPAVAVAVVVENAGQGSAVAAPIAGAVMQAALRR
ncbi:MAG: peptidoglycan D,D-transpeptidase FtsI family protein [Dehalococcoidia bacterium]